MISIFTSCGSKDKPEIKTVPQDRIGPIPQEKTKQKI
jgi:hypothetical protein